VGLVDRDDRKLMPTDTKQGNAVVLYLNGWTALLVHDRTVDDRPNSKSAFLFPAELDFDAALAEAERLFPFIVKRVGPITSAHHATPVSERPQGQR
jgi:hypothetical protein